MNIVLKPRDVQYIIETLDDDDSSINGDRSGLLLLELQRQLLVNRKRPSTPQRISK